MTDRHSGIKVRMPVHPPQAHRELLLMMSAKWRSCDQACTCTHINAMLMMMVTMIIVLVSIDDGDDDNGYDQYE